MENQIKFKVKFQVNIQDILWNLDFVDVLKRAKNKKNGTKIHFNGEEMVVDISNDKPPIKALIWKVPVKIDNRNETFTFKIPIDINNPEELMSLDRGVCNITHPTLVNLQLYSVKGHYNPRENILEIKDIHPIKP